VIKPVDIEAFTIILCRFCKKIDALCAGILEWDWSAVVWNAPASNRPFCKM